MPNNLIFTYDPYDRFSNQVNDTIYCPVCDEYIPTAEFDDHQCTKDEENDK